MPNSMYTAKPVLAMIAPMTHINRANPTEPVLANIDEGVAKIPVPMMRLKMRKMAETRPIVRFAAGTSSKDSPSRADGVRHLDVG